MRSNSRQSGSGSPSSSSTRVSEIPCSSITSSYTPGGSQVMCWRTSAATAGASVLAPVTRGATPEHGAELLGGLREQLAGAPVEDDAVLADEVVHGQLAVTEALGYLFRGGRQPLEPLVPDSLAFAGGGVEVDLVPSELRVQLVQHDTVVLARAVESDVAVGDVVAHSLGLPLQRVAVAAPAGRAAREVVAAADRNVREDRSEIARLLVPLTQPHALGDRRQAALDSPRNRASTVAAVRHD